MAERIEQLSSAPFISGPAEFLSQTVVEQLKADSRWKAFFGDAMDGYKRMDYQIRNFPALRVFCEGFRKDYESWFVEGDLKIQAIFPPSIRRVETQRIPETVASALLQQFRRATFFEAVGAVVKGLNELGKRFEVDNALGFMAADDSEPAPLSQITVNFRIDLREWDLYLESDGRTKEQPFERTLGDLKRIKGVIEGLNDDEEVQVEVGTDQKVSEE
jgi:hypothetical protein